MGERFLPQRSIGCIHRNGLTVLQAIKDEVWRGCKNLKKKFNVTGLCLPDKHYMADISERLEEMKGYIEDGDYFTINRARQYGKTTTLNALKRRFENEYMIFLISFEGIEEEVFADAGSFCVRLLGLLYDTIDFGEVIGVPEDIREELYQRSIGDPKDVNFRVLTNLLTRLCRKANKPVVLMVDEVDQAGDYQVFVTFLGCLRDMYLKRDTRPAFRSVILAGVYDIKNLKDKIRPENEHVSNSPWNIASDFDVDMSLSVKNIVQMLEMYEADYHTGMDVSAIAQLIYDYTSGYPFLVSKICKLTDETIAENGKFAGKSEAWTRDGVLSAIQRLLVERNTLFESLTGKVESSPELENMLYTLLFVGKDIPYNADHKAIAAASMFGFVKNRDGNVELANRIFEMRLYNRFLSAEELQNHRIYQESLYDKNQFIAGGYLNMRLILEKFVEHFHDLYADSEETFIEESGRKLFLLYLRPIINGTGNYYVESRTRSMGRTDVIVDYRGEQYIIEIKIWRGKEYHNRGEEQIAGYLEDYHKNKGYMLSFCFNKKKQIGVKEFVIGNKTVIEAVV